MAFSYTTDKVSDIAVFTLKGRITSENDIDQIQAEASTLSKIIFDISDLEHINSTGINFMIRTLTRTRVNGGDLVICGLGGSVKKLFELSKIDGLFTLKSSVTEGKNYFNTAK